MAPAASEREPDHDAARTVADRAVAPVVDHEAVAPATTVKTVPEAEADEMVVPKRKSRGFSGFFGKFKRRSQVPESGAVTSPSKLNKQAGTLAAAGIGAASGTTGHAGELSDSASESSFQRNRTVLHSISSMSSSDLEGEARRGNAGAESDEEGEFEEARDHFDESSVPATNFGAQHKSSIDEARETKFVEQL